MKRTPFLIVQILVLVVVMAALVWFLLLNQKLGGLAKSSDIAQRLAGGANSAPLPFENLDSNFDRSVLDKNIYALPLEIRPRGLNIVMVSESFASQKDFKIATEFVKDTFTKWVEPWKRYQDFNFYSVYTGQDKFCRVETENHVKPTLRCTTKINDYLVPLRLYRYKVIIVSRQDFTSWANVTRIKNSLVAYSLPKSKEGQDFYRKVILHEFAHGFGLRDEMTKSVIALAGSEATKPEGPNCAPDLVKANEWWGDMVKRQSGALYFDQAASDVGFYFGCAGNENYIKPTAGSLMNMQDLTKSSDSYGPVSERYLRKILEYCFSPMRHSAADDPKFFELYPGYKECLPK